MADPQFTATGVQIGRWLRSVTRAGQVLIRDGRLELLNSRGSEIDSAPVQSVRAAGWFATRDRALATVNGRRYLLTLGDDGRGTATGTEEANRASAHRFLDALRTAGGQDARG